MGFRFRLMRCAIAAALTASGLCASAEAAAVPLKKSGRTTATLASGGKLRSQMIDIALDHDRTLRGRFVDSAGAAIDGAVVTLKQSDRVIARSSTLTDGTFQIERVPAGTYRLSCGSASGPIRCWTSDAAPPNAVVDGVTFQDNVIRGQAIALAPALIGTSAITTAAASGSVIGGVAVYAAAEGGTQSGSSTAPPTAPPPAAPASPAVDYTGQIVGRDEHGNLVRFRGDAPWKEKGPGMNGDPRPSDASGIVLPSNWPASFDEARWPASP